MRESPEKNEIMLNGPLGAAAIAAIWIVLFFIFRAAVLWYWRVNEGIALLKSIDEKLARIAGNTPESKEPYIR
jgi:hypothetical protein